MAKKDDKAPTRRSVGIPTESVGKELTEKWKFYALAGLILVILVGAGVLAYEIKNSNPKTDAASSDAAEMKNQVEALNKKIDDLNKSLAEAKNQTTETSSTSVKTGTVAGASTSSGSGEVSGLVNINAADLAALDTLPQIGPVTAQAIIDYRNTNGPFKSIDELDNVKGIGPATINKVRDLVSI